MKLDTLIKNLYNIVVTWLDTKPTGKLNIEIHANEGGIGKVYRRLEDEVKDDNK